MPIEQAKVIFERAEVILAIVTIVVLAIIIAVNEVISIRIAMIVQFIKANWHNRRSNFIKNYQPSTESDRVHEEDIRNRMRHQDCTSEYTRVDK